MPDSVSLTEYFAVVWTYRWFILLAVLVATIAATVTVRYEPKVYEASAMLRSLQPTPWMSGGLRTAVVADSERGPGSPTLSALVSTAPKVDGWVPVAEAFLRSLDVAGKVVDAPDVKAVAGDLSPAGLAAGVRIEPLREPTVFRVVVRGRSPEAAAMLLDRVIAQARATLKEREADVIREQREAAERDIAAARRRLDALSTSSGAAEISREAHALEVRSARQVYLDLVAQYSLLPSIGLPHLFPRLEVVDAPRGNPSPVDPSLRRRVLAAVVPSAFAAILMVFLIDGWRRRRAAVSSTR